MSPTTTSIKARGWSMPEWMRPFAPLITNTGRHDSGDPKVIEQMFNKHTDPRVNLPLSTLEACVIAQVSLLERLRVEGYFDGSGALVPSRTRLRLRMNRVANSLAMVAASRACPKHLRGGILAASEELSTGLEEDAKLYGAEVKRAPRYE